jgi:hypothetical protein
VQVAPQPPAFLLAGRDQPLPGALQVGGEAYGVDGQPGVRGQVPHEHVVAARERHVRAEHQAARSARPDIGSGQ